MAVGAGSRIDRPVEAEMLANAARRQVHDLIEQFFKPWLVHLGGSVAVDVKRERLCGADRIGDLGRTAVSQSGRNNVLGEGARPVGGGAIDLGGVLAGERTAPMGGRPALGVPE